ncbi:MAG: hypothetical protein V1806_05900 [Pseudomonadota bacterium]
MAALFTLEDVRALFREQGGRASLSLIYERAADKAAQATREISQLVERLEAKGELKPEGREYVLVLVPETRGRKGTAADVLWRGVHQLSRHGAFGTADLARVAGVIQRSARTYVAAMLAAGLLVQVRPGRYAVAKGAPHRDSPPPFRWHKKSQAKELAAAGGSKSLGR